MSNYRYHRALIKQNYEVNLAIVLFHGTRYFIPPKPVARPYFRIIGTDVSLMTRFHYRNQCGTLQLTWTSAPIIERPPTRQSFWRFHHKIDDVPAIHGANSPDIKRRFDVRYYENFNGFFAIVRYLLRTPDYKADIDVSIKLLIHDASDVWRRTDNQYKMSWTRRRVHNRTLY